MATKSQIERAVESHLPAAAARGATRRPRGDLAKSVTYDAKRKRLRIEFVSGSAVAIPVSRVEELAVATAEQIKAVKVVGDGYGLQWTAIDLDLPVFVLMAEGFDTRAWVGTFGGRVE